MNGDYQYLVDYEKKVKQQLAKANINYRSKNRDKINQLAKTIKWPLAKTQTFFARKLKTLVRN